MRDMLLPHSSQGPLTNSTFVAVAVLGLAARPAATDRVSGGCASLLGFTPTSWGLGGVGGQWGGQSCRAG